MTETEYRQAEGLSGNSLKWLFKSPAHYLHNKLNPKEPTPAQIFGTLCHKAVLQFDDFFNDYAIFDENELIDWSLCRNKDGSESKVKRNTEYYKGEIAKFHVDNAGKILITNDDYTKAINIRKAVQNSKSAMGYLQGGVAEKAIFWDYGGVKCKGLLDKVNNAIIDIKTTVNAQPYAFAKTIFDNGYHLQLSHYQLGYKILYGKELPVVFIAIESEPPFGLGVYRMSQDALDLGLATNESLYKTYAECEKTGIWTAYRDSVEEIDLPLYAYS